MVIERFQEDFGVTVEHVAESSSSVWLNAARRARAAGQGFDVALVQPVPALTDGVREHMWAPLRPLLFRPDVLDDAAWRGGVEGRFLDARGELCFDWEYQVHHAYAINTDLVGEHEIARAQDLLDPKWRGRIVSSDPRVGDGLLAAAAALKHLGAGALRTLLVDQRPTVTTVGWDGGLAEAFARGSHAIARNLRPKPLNVVREKGLGQNVRYLDLPEVDFVPSTALLYVDQAPHPAAARLYANWILSPEGQTLLTEALHTNSARTDVAPYEADGIGTLGSGYFDPDREAEYGHVAQAQQVVGRLLDPRG
jgi:iron(III) transport system substrate-binding protein